MEEHFHKGKYVPLQTGQIPGLESKVILIDGAQLAELTFIELFVFTSPTIRTAGRTNPRSIKKRCAPVSIGLCGLRRKRRDLGHDSVLILRDGTELPSGGSAIGYTPGYWLALSYPTSKAALAASRPSTSMRPRAACNRSCF